MDSLRALLIQRAARLQERPALSAPEWGTLSWSAWRNRVEGVALGLLAQGDFPSGVRAEGGPWAWTCEVAAACCGLRWDPRGEPPDPAIFGGSRFNPDEGRTPYHAREGTLGPRTPFTASLDHGVFLSRLRALNLSLGWDHDTELRLPLSGLGDPAVRGGLWSLLYAGGHARLAEIPDRAWDPAPFRALGL